MKISIPQMLAGLGTAVGAGCLTSTSTGIEAVGAASAAVALSGVAGTLISNVGSEMAGAFRTRIAERWSPAPRSPRVAADLWTCCVEAVADVLEAMDREARIAAHADADAAHRWTNVLIPFGDRMRAALLADAEAPSEAARLGPDLDRTFRRTVAEWVDAEAGGRSFGAEVGGRVLHYMASLIGSEPVELPAEFVAAFTGLGEREGWFGRFKARTGARMVESAEFARAWEAKANALLTLLVETLTEFGEPPLDIAMPALHRPEGFERFVFTSRWTRLRGREDELARVMAFGLAGEEEPAFRLAHVSAAGGHGKSRLALEACRQLAATSNVHAGFLPRGARPREGWDHWRPNVPTFLVVDYASDRAEEVGSMIRSLSRIGRDLPHPVRLLLLSREGGLFARGRGSESWSRVMVGGSHFEEAAIRSAVAWELQLAGMGDPWRVMQDVFEARCVAAPARDEALAALGVIDPEETPLFAILVADALADGERIVSGDRLTFLQRTIERQVVRAGSHGSERETLLNLAALATLSRGFDVADLAEHVAGLADTGVDVTGFRLPGDDLERAVEFMARLTGRRDGAWLHGLEPDLLGEALVVERLSGMGPRVRARARMLRDLAWWANSRHRRGETAVTEVLALLLQDFPREALRSTLLELPDGADGEVRRLWSAFIARAIGIVAALGDAASVVDLLELFEREVPPERLDDAAVLASRIEAERDSFQLLVEQGRPDLAIAQHRRSRIMEALGGRTLSADCTGALFFLNGLAAVEMARLDHPMDQLEEVLIAPFHPDRPITYEGGFSERYLIDIVRCILCLDANDRPEEALELAERFFFCFEASYSRSRWDEFVGYAVHIAIVMVRRGRPIARDWVVRAFALFGRGPLPAEWAVTLRHVLMLELLLAASGPPDRRLAPTAYRVYLQFAPADPNSSVAMSLVFYDWRRSCLPLEGAAIVDRIVANNLPLWSLRGFWDVRYVVRGYVDAAESQQADGGWLAGRRAALLARELAAWGLPADAIVEQTDERERQRVETMPGVREPQNRRVEFCLDWRADGATCEMARALDESDLQFFLEAFERHLRLLEDEVTNSRDRALLLLTVAVANRATRDRPEERLRIVAALAAARP